MNKWAIPDIHGRMDVLARLWEHPDFAPDLMEDHVYFLGDMIDRGPDSAEVVKFIRGLCDANPNVTAIYGNHEDLAINAQIASDDGYPIQYDDIYLWDMNGGHATKNSYRDTYGNEWREKLHDDLRWIKTLPFYVEDEDGFFFSHAPLPREWRRPPSLKGKPFTTKELIWSYPESGDEPGFARNFSKDDLKNIVGVCGHVHALNKKPMVMAPRLYDHYIFADAGCGCYPKAPLVAIEVQTRRVVYSWPVEAQETMSE